MQYFFEKFGCPKDPPVLFLAPEKWGDSQVGFRGSNASGRRIVLLAGALAGTTPRQPLSTAPLNWEALNVHFANVHFCF